MEVVMTKSPLVVKMEKVVDHHQEVAAGVNKEDEMESARAEMESAKQENERLKLVLDRAAKEYQTLQLQFSHIIHQEQQAKISKASVTNQKPQQDIIHEDQNELISLRLGTTVSSTLHKKEEEKMMIDTAAGRSAESKEEEKVSEGLELSLNCKFEKSSSSSSSEDSVEDARKEGGGGGGGDDGGRKVLKTRTRSGVDEETSGFNHIKKARVSVRARCDGATMNDGCHWRKYGQKIAKGNPCPRSYYRCTVAPSCPVRKQVQRCADDISILITTYEGTHNHPLPPAANAMASATSAAMGVLLSESSTSGPSTGAPETTANTAFYNAGLHGLHFSLSDNPRPRQYYPPCPSISFSPSHPTITLDLTSQATPFSRFPTNFTSNIPGYYPSFNFSTSESTTTSPAPWSNNGYLNYGAQLNNSNQNQVVTLNLGGQSKEHLYQQSYLQKTTDTVPPPATKLSMTDTIAAATKVITSDPSFQSAFAVAITSIVGGHGRQGMGEQLSSVSAYSSSPKRNLMFHQPSLAFSDPKSSSSSPAENREHII